MRLSQRRQKHFPVKTLRERLETANRKSHEAKDMFETVNEGNIKQADDPSLSKFRGKSLKAAKYSINHNIGINHSFMDLGKEMKSKKTLI